MSKLKLVESKSLTEEIKEIELPEFDVVFHEDETWFTEAVKQHEAALKKMENPNDE